MFRNSRLRGLDILLVFILAFSVLLFLGIEYRQTKQALWKIQIDFERQKSKDGKDEVDDENLSSSTQGHLDKKIDDGVYVESNGANPNPHIQANTMERVPSMAQNNKQNGPEKPTQANKKDTVLAHSSKVNNPSKLVQTNNKDKGSAMDKNKKTKLTEQIKDATAKEIYCPEKPTLMGNITVNTNPKAAKPVEMNKVRFGGWWSPDHCKARVKVAILVPLRNRPTQLQVFLKHITPVLQRQLLHYRIFVIEQVGKTLFNKGAIYNIGFNETLGYDDYDCYIFHDVDLLTENDHNYYGCPSSPLHMSVAIDKFKYRLPYPEIFGGIQAFKKDHYVTLNGYSNKYWGWGAEDDDLFRRAKDAKLPVHRAEASIARYKMNKEYHYSKKIDHSVWKARNKGLLFHHPLNRKNEGLNTTRALTYTKNIVEHDLYTNILIDLVFHEGV